MDFSSWIGRTETVEDVVDKYRMAGLHALLDADGPPPSVLPPLGHWLLSPPNVRQSEIDIDGHPKRGGNGLLPPIALPRRMWAGSHVTFLSAIPVGAQIQRRSTIAAIVAKQGGSGPLLFVTIDHEIICDGAAAVRERQDLVYRDAAAPGTVAEKPKQDLSEPQAHRIFQPDSVSLFRYSALTFNGHRIHYDRDYARDAEGYPGLVVHAPYAATLLLDLYRRMNPAVGIRRFAFRARAPMYDTGPILLSCADDRLWALTQDGGVAMTADVQRH